MASLTTSDAGTKLLDALREFVGDQPAPKKKPVESVTVADVTWVLLALAGAGLAMTLVPDAWKGSDMTKKVINDVLPWILNLTTIGAILKSPVAVVQIARKRSFKAAVTAIVPILAAMVIPFFRVDPVLAKTADGAQVSVDSHSRSGAFYVNLGPHTVELKSGGLSRTLHMRVLPLLFGAYTRPDWRPLHEFTITVRPQDISVCI